MLRWYSSLLHWCVWFDERSVFIVVVFGHQSVVLVECVGELLVGLACVEEILHWKWCFLIGVVGLI